VEGSLATMPSERVEDHSESDELAQRRARRIAAAGA
jgi:hypothetical protein